MSSLITAIYNNIFVLKDKTQNPEIIQGTIIVTILINVNVEVL